jgi:hypothetical protein
VGQEEEIRGELGGAVTSYELNEDAKSYLSDRINRIDGIFSGSPAERLETAGWFAAIRRKEDRVYLTLKTLHLTLSETCTP